MRLVGCDELFALEGGVIVETQNLKAVAQRCQHGPVGAQALCGLGTSVTEVDHGIDGCRILDSATGVGVAWKGCDMILPEVPAGALKRNQGLGV